MAPTVSACGPHVNRASSFFPNAHHPRKTPPLRGEFLSYLRFTPTSEFDPLHLSLFLNMASNVDTGRNPIKEAYSLSPLQEGMLFQSLFRQQNGKDITQVISELEEGIEAARFENAWRSTVQKHPILRTSFHWERLPKPEQRVHRHVQFELAQKDCRAWSGPQIEEWLQKDRQTDFELTVPPMFRVTLLRTAEAKWQCVFTYHHILLDAR